MTPTDLLDEPLPPDEVLDALRTLAGGDVDWRGGRAFSLVYNSGDDEHERLLEAVTAAFCHENALNPFVVPGLVQMEADVVATAAALLGGSPADAGCLSSGGTESIFLAVLVAREEARARGVAAPAIVTADTAHPAFAKACHHLGVEEVRVAHRTDGRADPAAMAAALDALDGRVAMVVASAPCYPFGVVDPVEEVAALAAERGVLCHVDACLGGWLLPFWRDLGEPVPAFDMSVPGVTSLSADLHKYGWATKGASVLLHARRDLLMRQLWMFDGWPGGLYGSLTAAGTRPGAPIAAAWASVRHLGRDGYRRLAAEVRDATRTIVAGVDAIDGLRTTHPPDLSVLEIASDTAPIGAVADRLEEKGWHVDRQQGGLHLIVSAFHATVADRFVADLADAVAHHGTDAGREATYGAGRVG